MAITYNSCKTTNYQNNGLFYYVTYSYPKSIVYLPPHHVFLLQDWCRIYNKRGIMDNKPPTNPPYPYSPASQIPFPSSYSSYLLQCKGESCLVDSCDIIALTWPVQTANAVA